LPSDIRSDWLRILEAGIVRAETAFHSQFLFNPLTVRSGDYKRFWTAAFAIFDDGTLVAGLVGLWLFGVPLEVSLHWTQFLVVSVLILLGTPLLSFGLSFAEYVTILSGPYFYIIGLGVCSAVFRPGSTVPLPFFSISTGLALCLYLLFVTILEGRSEPYLSGILLGVVTGYLVGKIVQSDLIENQDVGSCVSSSLKTRGSLFINCDRVLPG
jgi:hypothetical protein